MKIAYVYNNMHRPGGIESITTTKINYLADIDGDEVHLILASDGKEPPFNPLSDKVKIHYLDIPYQKTNSLRKAPQWYFNNKRAKKLHEQKMTDLLLKEKFDIVICVFFNPAVNFLYKIKDGSKKIVETHQDKYGSVQEADNSKYPFITGFFHRRHVKFCDEIAKKYDAFTVLTHSDKVDWECQNNIHVIYNTTEFVEKYRDVQANLESKIVLNVGRVTHNRHKGHEDLIQAWQKVAEKHPDWRLVMMGRKPPKTDNLDPLIEQLGLQNSITIEDACEDISVFYRQASIFAFSSRYEGFGIALVEAKSFGLPVVSTNCHHGPSEIVKEGEDGYLVPVRDTNALAEKIIHLIENEGLRREMGAKAKENVKMFSTENVMTQWKNLFKELINQ